MRAGYSDLGSNLRGCIALGPRDAPLLGTSRPLKKDLWLKLKSVLHKRMRRPENYPEFVKVLIQRSSDYGLSLKT